MCLMIIVMVSIPLFPIWNNLTLTNASRQTPTAIHKTKRIPLRNINEP